MTTRNYQGIKVDNNEVIITSDALTIEGALQISVNGKPFTMTMRTPGNDPALVRGLLHTEGVIRDVNYQPELTVDVEEKNQVITTADVTIPEHMLGEGYLNSRTLLSVSSCGICGKTELDENFCEDDKLDDEWTTDARTIDEMFEKMNHYQKTFQRSGGSHAAAIFDLNGTLLSCLEDIGRHNAVDKVIGELVLGNTIKNAAVLTVSGRISYEIVIKCFKAKIPVLAAVSAPSSLAVDYAKELGITLLAFCRKGRATCYSNTHRIKNLNLKNQAS